MIHISEIINAAFRQPIKIASFQFKNNYIKISLTHSAEDGHKEYSKNKNVN